MAYGAHVTTVIVTGAVRLAIANCLLTVVWVPVGVAPLPATVTVLNLWLLAISSVSVCVEPWNLLELFELHVQPFAALEAGVIV